MTGGKAKSEPSAQVCAQQPGLPALGPAGVGLNPVPLSTGCLVTDSPVAQGQSTAEYSLGIVIKILLHKLIAYISTGIAHWSAGFADSENACNFSGFLQFVKVSFPFQKHQSTQMGFSYPGARS